MPTPPFHSTYANEQGELTATLTCPISVAYHLELCVAMIIYRH